MDYRDDDDRSTGFCPVCGRRVSDLTTEATGYCEIHGRVFVEFERPAGNPDGEEE